MLRRQRKSGAAASGNWGLITLVGAGLAAVTAVVYWQVIGFQFVGYDDPFYVTNNRHVRMGLSWASITWAWTSLRAFWHPLTWMSHMLDWQLWPNQPAGHHAVNLFLHVVGGLAALVAWHLLLGRVWPAVFIAALFLLHPLRAESVSWVAERKGLLAALAWMLGLAAYAFYARRPSWQRYLLVFAAMAVGLLCKPSLVPFPLALLLLDVWPLGRWRPAAMDGSAYRGVTPVEGRSVGFLLLEKLPLVGLSLVASYIALHAEEQFGALEWLPGLTLASRVKNALITPWLYLGKLVWPADLAFFYRHPGNAVSDVAAAFGGAGLIAVTGVCLWQFRRRPYLLVGWLWFLITLAPVSGLVQVGGHRMADRYVDIPLIGVYAACAALLAELVARRPATKELVVGCSLVAVIALAVFSYRQASFWRNDTALYEHAIAVDPDNWVALTNRARQRLNAGVFDAALDDCRLAWAVQHNAAISANMADVYFRQDKLDDALEWSRETIELAPSVGPHYLQLAGILAKQGEHDQADAAFRDAVRLAPDNPLVLRNYAAYLGSQFRLDEAAGMFRQALAIDPDNAGDYLNLARTLIVAADYAGAQEAIDAALRRQPSLLEAYQLQADCQARQGLTREAMLSFQRGAPLAPSSMMRVVWILAADPRAEMRNPERALALGRQLDEMSGHREPAALDTLAMALAAGGGFEEAARAAGEGAALARRANRTKLAELIESRQALYRSKRPFTAPYADIAKDWDRGDL